MPGKGKMHEVSPVDHKTVTQGLGMHSEGQVRNQSSLNCAFSSVKITHVIEG